MIPKTEVVRPSGGVQPNEKLLVIVLESTVTILLGRGLLLL